MHQRHCGATMHWPSVTVAGLCRVARITPNHAPRARTTRTTRADRTLHDEHAALFQTDAPHASVHFRRDTRERAICKVFTFHWNYFRTLLARPFSANRSALLGCAWFAREWAWRRRRDAAPLRAALCSLGRPVDSRPIDDSWARRAGGVAVRGSPATSGPARRRRDTRQDASAPQRYYMTLTCYTFCQPAGEPFALQ